MTGIAQISPASASAFESTRNLQLGRKGGKIQFSLPPLQAAPAVAGPTSSGQATKGNAVTGPLIAKINQSILA
jgi:hypothetical protein